ncbi:pyroglutamyl-peptidase 1 [Pristis pectinata]|uniref:pyroglutamyl-peptidase 1 n=1 Tax=Pristis pectinata TaxID=685728 RepID=UPI00223E594B|nr:pyroglutamyl-peptidase 1 [Pristis pectinata]
MDSDTPKNDPDSSSQLVLVTGFGPFRRYLRNPSWVAVQELKALGLGENVQMEVAELPVHYQRARELVTRMWETLRPQLAVHVGVATASKTVILEQCAKNHGYVDGDICGLTPEGGCCIKGGPEEIESLINMRAICKKLPATDVAVIHSRNAGRFLCDFAYYTSLYHGNRRACFIHIPAPSTGWGAKTLGKILQLIIREMLEQLETEVY